MREHACACMCSHACNVSSSVYPQIIKGINQSYYFLKVRHNKHLLKIASILSICKETKTVNPDTEKCLGTLLSKQ